MSSTLIVPRSVTAESAEGLKPPFEVGQEVYAQVTFPPDICSLKVAIHARVIEVPGVDDARVWVVPLCTQEDNFRTRMLFPAHELQKEPPQNGAVVIESEYQLSLYYLMQHAITHREQISKDTVQQLQALLDGTIVLSPPPAAEAAEEELPSREEVLGMCNPKSLLSEFNREPIQDGSKIFVHRDEHGLCESTMVCNAGWPGWHYYDFDGDYLLCHVENIRRSLPEGVLLIKTSDQWSALRDLQDGIYKGSDDYLFKIITDRLIARIMRRTHPLVLSHLERGILEGMPENQ